MGTPISCNSVSVQHNLNAKASYILKFTSFLAKHSEAPLGCKEIYMEQRTSKCNISQL